MAICTRPQPHFFGFGVDLIASSVKRCGLGVVVFRGVPLVRKGVTALSRFRLFLPSFLFLILLRAKRRKSDFLFRWNSTGLSTGIPVSGLALAVISASFFRCRVHRNSTGLSAVRGELGSPHGEHDDVHRHAVGHQFFQHVGDRRHCSLVTMASNAGNFSNAAATPDISRATASSSSVNSHLNLKIASRFRHMSCSATIGDRLNHSP